MKRLPFVFLCAFSACTVGSPLATQSGDGGGIDTPGVDSSNGCVTRSATPVTRHSHQVGLTDNAGQPCVMSGCHLTGAVGLDMAGNPAPAWQFAGTLYQGDMVTPNAGAHIIITDAGGTTHLMTTDDGGNFYQSAGAITNPFPGHAAVTACPNAPTIMTDLLQATGTAPAANGDNCNGCHIPGGVLPQTTPLVLTP